MSEILYSMPINGPACLPIAGRKPVSRGKTMKVLLTGGSGNLGQTLVPRLLDHGDTPVILDVRAPRDRKKGALFAEGSIPLVTAPWPTFRLPVWAGVIFRSFEASSQRNSPAKATFCGKSTAVPLADCSTFGDLTPEGRSARNSLPV